MVTSFKFNETGTFSVKSGINIKRCMSGWTSGGAG